jgi:hypothetical protein
LIAWNLESVDKYDALKCDSLNFRLVQSYLKKEEECFLWNSLDQNDATLFARVSWALPG